MDNLNQLYYTGCIKKTEQTLNCSKRHEAALSMEFLINIDCLSWSLENLLGVLLLCKISRNLVEFKPFKTFCECIFF